MTTTTETRNFTRDEAKAADKELYFAMLNVAHKQAAVESALNSVHHSVNDDYKSRYNSRSGWKLSEAEAIEQASDLAATDTTHRGRNAQTALDRYNAASAALAEAREAKKAADKWADHGRWNRYAVVPGGHIHNDAGCFTLRWDTDVRWAWPVSGDSVAEAIETYGEALCSHCYPDAPVAQTLGKVEVDADGHPISKAAAQAARDAKAAEKAAKEAAKNAAAVVDPATGKVLYKTERAATNAIASVLDYYFSYGDEKYLTSARADIVAVAAKRGVDAQALEAELVAKAEVKFRKAAIRQIKNLLVQPTWGNHNPADPTNWRESYRRIAQEEGLI